MNRVANPLVWVYRVLFVISWVLILTFTLAQVIISKKTFEYKIK